MCESKSPTTPILPAPAHIASPRFSPDHFRTDSDKQRGNEILSQTSFFDKLLGKRDRGDAPIVNQIRLGTSRAALAMVSASGKDTARGFSQSTIFPACAAAIAMVRARRSAWQYRRPEYLAG